MKNHVYNMLKVLLRRILFKTYYFMCACLHIIYVHHIRAVPTEPEGGSMDPQEQEFE